MVAAVVIVTRKERTVMVIWCSQTKDTCHPRCWGACYFLGTRLSSKSFGRFNNVTITREFGIFTVDFCRARSGGVWLPGLRASQVLLGQMQSHRLLSIGYHSRDLGAEIRN